MIFLLDTFYNPLYMLKSCNLTVLVSLHDREMPIRKQDPLLDGVYILPEKLDYTQLHK